ncbi:hypothetical protein IJD44_06430, partial [bacterium]|nr:hypothetical protein [bacterium]
FSYRISEISHLFNLGAYIIVRGENSRWSGRTPIKILESHAEVTQKSGVNSLVKIRHYGVAFFVGKNSVL